MENFKMLLNILTENDALKIVIVGVFNVNFLQNSNNCTKLICPLNSFNLDLYEPTTLSNPLSSDFETGITDPCLSDFG